MCRWTRGRIEGGHRIWAALATLPLVENYIAQVDVRLRNCRPGGEARHFRCGAYGRKGCVFFEPRVESDGAEPFPAGRELVIGGERRPDETWPERDARVRREYLWRFPSGDALG